ncbi:uncharacterized protein LOC123536403 isoform X3 [Mercenaria mercenaria]|uniref:uncharacterized protein LOC123536403 isoform X3 n=1 Tax=Mercenaria mercenaria TaxID=6596 RepID=UPI00234EF11E|nr:uncharacterized protein LOC123536403 isoform X3 [Mercenaria mercenaria]
MDDLRSWWEVPSIAHFCSLFRSAFDLTDFDIEDLEEGFIQAQTEDGSAFLLDLLCHLLNGCYGRKDITITNYDLYVKDIIKYKWDITDSPIKEKSEFKALTLREKVELIYAICEYRLDTEDVIEQLKGFEGDSMRVEPLGKDKDGALYWYFYGSRLYMEDPEPKKELTKEEKRAKDRERRIEAKKKKQDEKKQKKEEKRKMKALRKVERKKKLEEAKKIEESNTRRSGRLRTRKIEIPESESSDTSSSSEEEEETEESSHDESEKVEKKSSKGRAKRTPAKTTTKKETTNQKTPSTKKETPSKQGTRSSSRNVAKQQKNPDPKTLQADTGTRRSARSRRKPEPPPLPSPYNSETEEDNDYDNDSGHESAGSLRSETSKVSVRSGTSKKSVTPGKRSARRPTVNVDLKRDLSRTDEDGDEEEEKNNDVCDKENDEKEKDDVTSCKDKDDDDKKEKDDKETDKDYCKEENEMEVDDDNNGKGLCLTEEGKGDSKKEGDEVETSKDEIVEDDGSGEGKVDKKKTVDDSDTKVVADAGTKSEHELSRETDEIEPKEEQTDQVKVEELEKTDNTCDNKNSENISEKDENRDVAAATADSDKDDVNIKTENTEVKTEEKMETDNDNAVVSESTVEKKDTESENSNIEKENIDVKPEIEETSNDSNDAGVKRVLRKRNAEEVKTEPKNSDDDSKEGSEANEESNSCEFSLSKPAVAPQPSKSSTRWHLVCETLDDWINFAEWYKDSPVRCEKSLSKVIREDFLPVLPEIIEAREKEKQRRYLQEQDLRRSNRITMKMREKMEQEKILAEALAEEEKARIKAEEERRLKEEQLRLEDENRQREERRKAREERAKRLSMREERARLLAEGKEIPPEMIYTAPAQKYKDEGEDSDDSKCDLKEEEDYEALTKVINAMKYHKDCWPFLEPVTDEQAPGYSDVIKRPMDLSKIEEKVENREYRSTQHFLSDFRLMFNNCKRFNGQDSEFSDCARSMENMLKKYMKRFVSEEPTDKYYEDKTFMVPGNRGAPRTGEKRYRPQRAASSRALQTVHNALNSDDEETDSEEEDKIPVRKKPKESTESRFKTQSHHNLLLQEMIELKRQREKKLAASALHNHGIITRGPERIRVPDPQGGVMIIPKAEMNSTGVLRMAATREIKRKVFTQPNLAQNVGRLSRPQVVHTLANQNQTVVKADLSKKDAGLSIIDQTTPGSTQPKTIRIVASNANGQPSVKQTAENVRVSSDGYLIISGKNSGIKVTENTKIVIQPPGATPPSTEGGSIPQASGKEVLIKKIPTPSSFKQLPGLSLSSITNTQGNTLTASPSATMQTPGQVPAQGVSASPSSQVPNQQQINLQGLLKQTAVNPQLNQQQALQGLVHQIGNKGNLSPEMKKKLDIAQRILLLNQQKRQLLEQQKLIKQHKQEQQNGPSPGVCPPKIIKLDSSSGAGNSSAIEERLRDPSLNIDKQLGSVSQNVISNVNIASDILDTYYSVLNDAKSTANNQNVPSATVTMPQNTQSLTRNTSMPQNSANIVVSLPHTSVQGVTGQTAQNVPVPQNQKPAPAQGNISEVTRQIYDLINKTGTGGLVSALAKAQLMKQNVPTSVSQSGAELIGIPKVQLSSVPSQNVTVSDIVNQTQQVIVSQSSQVDNQTPQVVVQTPKVVVQAPQIVNQTHQVVNQIPQVVNQVAQVVNQAPQTVPTLTSNSSISDLLRSAMLKPNTETSSEVSPIEALLSKTTPTKVETDSVSKTVPKSPLVQALTSRTQLSLNSVPKTFESSPEKNERQNLFDSFETSKSSAVPSAPPASANDLNLTGQMENTDVTKEIKLKLRADGISLPASSTLNFGSPLKTSSVLEALKCKLHTVKPQSQNSENPNSAESENVDKYSTSASSFSSLLPDQITLPSASGNAQNSSAISGFSPNVLNAQPPGMAVSLNSSNQAIVATGTMGQVMSLDCSNIPTSVPASGNVLQNTSQGGGIPLVFSSAPTIQVPTNLMQGNVQSAMLPTVLSQENGNLPNVSTVQGTFRQGPVQVPSALLQALKQGTSGVTVNQSTQSALLQQLNTLISNRQPNLQLGTQCTSVVNNIQQINPANTVQLINHPVSSILASSTLQCNLPKVHVQNIPQLSEVTFGNIGSIQSDNPGQIKMDAINESQGMDVNSTYSANSVAMTNPGVVSDSVVFSNHLGTADGTNVLNNFVASNLSVVNQTSVVTDGSITQSDQQSNFQMTGTDEEMIETSQDANTSLTDTAENQSQHNFIS